MEQTLTHSQPGVEALAPAPRAYYLLLPGVNIVVLFFSMAVTLSPLASF